MDTDRNLLFAVLALQADLIDRDRFIQACTLWAARKDTPMADLLVRQGWLAAEDCSDVERLLHRKLKKHGGDAQASLAEAASADARSALASVADAAVERSLAALPAERTKPDRMAPAADDFSTVPPSEGVTPAIEHLCTAPPTESAGRNLLYEEIGGGGMGRVLRGHDPLLRRELAVKVLREEYRGNGEVERRFVEEAQIGGQLQHPGVVPVYELGCFADRRPFFTMKLIKGRTLAELLKERLNLAHDLPRFLAIFEQVCQTVAYAHSKGVIHRDLKPQNVMVGAFGEVQVMDWGLAKVLSCRRPDSETTAAGTVIRTARSDSAAEENGRTGVVGTPTYMAPEQARGEIVAVDQRADVFGLGAILCVILTGKPPYAGDRADVVMIQAAMAELDEAFARLDGCGSDAELVALCKECLAPERDHRPRDAGAVAGQMAAYQAAVQERLRKAEIERTAAEARADAARAKAVVERRARRLTVGLATAVLLLVVLGGGGLWWVQSEQQTREAEAARRRQEADGAALLAMTEARLLLDQAKADPLGDASRFREARVAADKAKELAQLGEASEDVRRQATELVEAIGKEEDAAHRDRKLLAALLEVRGPREGPKFQKDDKGLMMMQVEPSADEQFQAAFRDWDATFDIDKLSTEEAATRLKGRPRAVLTEIVAALDEWTSERQRQLMPPEKRQPLAGLATALEQDDDSKRRELRDLATHGNLGRERALAVLALALRPVPIPFDAGLGRDRQRVQQLAREAKPETEPILGLLTLVRLLQAAGDEAGAERLLRAAIRVRPQEVVLHHTLGKLLTTQQPPRWSEAVECYAAARTLRPDLGDAMANSLLLSGRVVEGLALYDRLIIEQKDNPWLQRRRGDALYYKYRFQEAETAYRETLRLTPNYQGARVGLGNALAARRDLDGAITEFRKAIENNSKDAAPHYNLGNALRDKKELDGAIAEYKKAIELDPTYALAHNNLGNVLDDKQDPDGAIAEYKKAIELDPKDATPHYNLGNTLRDQGDLDGAIAEFRQAIELDPRDPHAHINLGVLLRRKGNLDGAIAAYKKAIDIAPYLATPYVSLGNALTDKGDLDGAVTAYRKAVDINPRYTAAHENLGWALLAQGRFSEARTVARRFLELLPERHPLRQRVSQQLRQCERLVAADEKLPAVLNGEAEPGDAAERLALGQLCGQYKHRHAAAVRLYADAFANDPRLAADLEQQNRYNAACSAALASARQGEDAKTLPDKVSQMLRRQALRWLREDLTLYEKLAQDKRAAVRQFIHHNLRHWQQDADIASVRDTAALDKLPDDERQQWRQLWDDVAALLKKVEPK
jgi:serine/threonine-protein kinase